MRKLLLLFVALFLLAWGVRELQRPQSASGPQTGAGPYIAHAPVAAPARDRVPAFLPPEAGATIALIQRGGPFPHRQDGSVFGNREQRLPQRPRGYYREYTVDTPGLRHRGARRIVTGGDPPAFWYYTDDHYDSFRSFHVPAKGGHHE